MLTPNTKIVLAILSFSVIFFSSFAFAQPQFMSLGNQWNGEAYGVSANGDVVVGHTFTSSPSGNIAFRWTASEGMTLLGSLPGGSSGRSSATATSGDGTVIVGHSGFSSVEAFRWTQSGGLMGLGNGGSFGNSIATGVSADGSVVVGISETATEPQAFRWTQQTGLVRLGYMGGLGNEAVGVSGDGSVVVGSAYGVDGCEHAFRWSQSTGRVWLAAVPGDFCNVAKTISADGSVIVGDIYGTTTPNEAFRWTQSTGIVGLGNRAGHNSSKALAVSGNGTTIVGYDIHNSWGSSEAIIWDKMHGFRPLRDVLVNDFGLNLAGWQLTEARGISADGMTIVGTGIQSGFTQWRPWIARLPEPATISNVIIVLASFSRRRRS